jgi:hypothetical protein
LFNQKVAKPVARGARFLQPKLSRLFNQKVAKPVARSSRVLSEMFVRTLELAQQRIAVSIAAIRRALNKLPPSSPPAAVPRIRPAPPTRKKPNGFRPM